MDTRRTVTAAAIFTVSLSLSSMITMAVGKPLVESGASANDLQPQVLVAQYQTGAGTQTQTNPPNWWGRTNTTTTTETQPRQQSGIETYLTGLGDRLRNFVANEINVLAGNNGQLFAGVRDWFGTTISQLQDAMNQAFARINPQGNRAISNRDQQQVR